ncbi:PfkB family carbohydrate kinase [Rhodococcus sp. IEGM 1379]|uniref:PfkB family carbohydrate kinase n=1 Tax=Rhodococcus sp. IEGM 1379 TaxID=3047086 RepID=UPI0024B8206D|nr:PfkB family carbohydrate kinase [Rhodococcus sp. IEGM 1379]MDI9917682.1 PfkB family carbohydrate kinase [Rhodococcus sp. IEGM 1379]
MRDSASSSDRQKPTVVVFGSVNADTSLFVDALPSPGESVHAKRIHRDSGGKGANQACAAAYAGASTAMLACIGDDAGGQQSRTALKNAGVDISGVLVVDAPTGSATITVDLHEAENTIVVDAGANALLSIDRVPMIDAAAVILQLEIPLEAVVAATRTASGTVILNAAPAAELSPELLSLVDVLVVNETELDVVARPFIREGTVLDKATGVEGPHTVIVTLGGSGALIVHDGRHVRIPAPSVVPVDTTGAGDCFVGTLAAHMVAGLTVEKAVTEAVAAASRSTLFYGARGYLT